MSNTADALNWPSAERGVRADLKRGVRILKRDHTVCRDVDHALETACECVRPMPLVATDGRL
ncbi:MAG: hypothetical protein M3R46_10760 [Actinomycetota bacterium]|nr:hypothetical protein [Actinomycetota bacterium]